MRTIRRLLQWLRQEPPVLTDKEARDHTRVGLYYTMIHHVSPIRAPNSRGDER